MLVLAEADAELQRLAVLRRNHADEQYLARRSLKELPDRIEQLARRAEKLGADMATLAAHEGVTVGHREMSHADAVEALTARLERLPERVSDTRTVPMGTYRGLAFGVVLHPMGGTDAYLDGQTVRRTELRDGAGGRALLNALDRLAGGYAAERERCERDRAVAEGQLEDYGVRLGTTFAHAGYERELTGLRDALRAGLSDKAEPKEGEPTVAELAERIKALRAVQAVEAAPVRVQRKKPEPVARRRAEVIALPTPEQEPQVPPPPPADDEDDPQAFSRRVRAKPAQWTLF